MERSLRNYELISQKNKVMENKNEFQQRLK